MLRFELRQIHLVGKRRYYLPLPKMSQYQLEVLATRLLGSGLSVRRTSGGVTAEGDLGRTVISKSGLASSNSDMLDLLSPAIPYLLDSPKEPSASDPYFAAKRLGDWFEIQLFTRMESSRLWSELRSEGKSGLTPDEKEVISRLLAGAESPVECVTDYPSEGCSVIRVGRKQYYRSLLPADELASHLRTIDTHSDRNSYLPRASVLRLRYRSIPSSGSSPELGEWCYLVPPKSL